MTKRPNIVFLFTDDQRFDTISALGNPEIDTPNMDRIVAKGTAFTNAHIMGGTHVAVCMPSRAMMLTGRTLFSLENQGQCIPPEHVTFPEQFRAAGYETCHVGKWHQDVESHHRSFSTGRKIYGFQKNGWYETCNGHWHTPVYDYDPTGQYEQDTFYNDPPLEPFQGPFDKTKAKGKHSAEMLTDSALDYMRERREADDEAPYLMYFAHLAPHDPRQYPARLKERYNRDTVSVPENFATTHPFDNGEMYVRDELLEAMPRRPEAVQQHVADYYAIIAHVDEQVGRILDDLEATGEDKNTILILAGDNGLACGQHGLMGKQNLYEHSIRVPLVMAGPGIPENQTSDTFCYLLDIYPTLCDLLGMEKPQTLEGKSLVPCFSDPAHQIRDSIHFAYRGFQRAVKKDHFKLIEYVVDKKRATQLFDLSLDPLEMNNLAGHPVFAKVQEELREELKKWRDEFHDTRLVGETFWENFDSSELLGPWLPGSHVFE